MSECLCARLAGTHPGRLRKPCRARVPSTDPACEETTAAVSSAPLSAGAPLPCGCQGLFSGVMTSCWDGDEWKCLIFHRLRHRNLSLLGRRALRSEDVGLALKIDTGCLLLQQRKKKRINVKLFLFQIILR